LAVVALPRPLAQACPLSFAVHHCQSGICSMFWNTVASAGAEEPGSESVEVPGEFGVGAGAAMLRDLPPQPAAHNSAQSRNTSATNF
jgi:hypothetical protein